jgi:hypothetical protein
LQAADEVGVPGIVHCWMIRKAEACRQKRVRSVGDFLMVGGGLGGKRGFFGRRKLQSQCHGGFLW